MTTLLPGTRWLLRACVLIGALVILSACGGGGGGGGGLSISLSPSRIEATLYQGEVRQFQVDGSASGTVSGNVYILIEDPQGLTDGNIPVSQVDVRRYRAIVTPRSTLTPGRYTGAIRIRVCGDFNCGNEYDSATLPYDITVVVRPTLQSLNPTGVAVGSGVIEVIVTGTAFTAGSVGRFNAQSRVTRFISPTQLGVSLTVNDTAVSGTYPIDVLGQAGNAASATTAANFEVRNPAPTLSSISPTVANLGGAAFQLQVNGSNLVAGSIVRWNGTDRVTQLISPAQLVAQILQTDLDTGGTASITVFNPGPGGGTSEAKTFDVNSPVPTLSLVVPAQLESANTPTPQTLQLTGTNFTRRSVGLWNGSPRETAYVSTTQLLVFLPATDVDDGMVAQVAVFNPAPAGGTSGSVELPISNPQPVLERINATRTSAGCGDFTLNVIGSQFRPSTQVLWNGSPRPTTRDSSSIVRAQITAADVADAGTATITVASPAPGGGVSTKAFEFEIADDPSPTTQAVAYQISPSHAGYATTRCPITVPTTSEPTWTYNAGEPMAYPLIVDGRVFVTGKTTGRVTALDAATGAVLWGPAKADSNNGIAYDNGTLFSTGGDRQTVKGAIVALDAATGALKWRIDLDSFNYLYPAVALDGRLIFSNSDDIEARSQEDGHVLWTNDHPGSGERIAADANGVYATGPCTTRAYKPDGSFKWNRNTGCSGGGGAIPSVAEGVVYSLNLSFASDSYDRLSEVDGSLIASLISDVLPARSPRHEIGLSDRALQGKVIATGATWGLSADSPPGYTFTAPILVNDTVFIARRDGQLLVHDANSGALLTAFNVGNPLPVDSSFYQRVDTGLAVGDGLLVVPTVQGVAAYRIASPAD